MTEVEPVIEKHPCGCQTATFPDGKVDYSPCAPCGLQKAGQLLQAVGNRLGQIAEETREKLKNPNRLRAVSGALCPHGKQPILCSECE